MAATWLLRASEGGLAVPLPTGFADCGNFNAFWENLKYCHLSEKVSNKNIFPLLEKISAKTIDKRLFAVYNESSEAMSDRSIDEF